MYLDAFDADDNNRYLIIFCEKIPRVYNVYCLHTRTLHAYLEDLYSRRYCTICWLLFRCVTIIKLPVYQIRNNSCCRLVFVVPN